LTVQRLLASAGHHEGPTLYGDRRQFEIVSVEAAIGLRGNLVTPCAATLSDFKGFLDRVANHDPLAVGVAAKTNNAYRLGALFSRIG
jgi:hypothetical protein